MKSYLRPLVLLSAMAFALQGHAVTPGSAGLAAAHQVQNPGAIAHEQ